MVADSVTIRTRRDQMTRDSDTTGWLFTTDGLNGFGELKRNDDPSVPTA